ncbi:MAG: cyclopropane-fatty-acyl-phospholipid synthase family protein [Gammaproteobacteria bacterium]|nr:cyclopropane-fatty-acyl-phospholipid synthase family protein [Gammaproteobacteria bacterium]
MYTRATNWSIEAAERGLIPDRLLRTGVRQLVKKRLREIRAADCESGAAAARQFVAAMNASDVALVPAVANEQHYEVPAEFFARALGAHRKYSCCYWAEGIGSLDEAEAESLRLTCAHAELRDGQQILELGCGWGSLTLWMAKHYPNAAITAVSNSQSQRAYITTAAAAQGLTNVHVITADMNTFAIDTKFDRVVSVEMFEHMRNYRELYSRINNWLVPGGKFFKHIFCHRTVPYEFVDEGTDDWMSRHFFTGGIMPCDSLPLHFQESLKFVQQWRWSGTHYERTANAWIENMERHKPQLLSILASTYGDKEALRWWHRWRLFFAACAELFGHADGQEWWVSHYLFERP